MNKIWICYEPKVVNISHCASPLRGAAALQRLLQQEESMSHSILVVEIADFRFVAAGKHYIGTNKACTLCLPPPRTRVHVYKEQQRRRAGNLSIVSDVEE